MTNSLSFDKCAYLCNHHYNQIIEYFHLIQKVPFSNPFTRPRQPLIYFLSLEIKFLLLTSFKMEPHSMSGFNIKLIFNNMYQRIAPFYCLVVFHFVDIYQFNCWIFESFPVLGHCQWSFNNNSFVGLQVITPLW